MIDMYEENQLVIIKDLGERQVLEGHITQFLLAQSELQEIEKGHAIYRGLVKEHRKITNSLTKKEKKLETAARTDLLQTKANASAYWALNSYTLLKSLSEGADRNRYSKKVGEEWVFDNPRINRKYLVIDYRSNFIRRIQAVEAVEKIVEAKSHFVKVRMGIGKSTVIFPQSVRLFNGKRH